MTTATPATPGTDAGDRDPGWLRVGLAIKEDRQRRGWTRPHLVQRVSSTGGHLTERALALVEQGRIANKGGASPDVAKRAWEALGWTGNLAARIQVDGAPLPPLHELRAATRPPANPAHRLTSTLHVTRSEPLARLEHRMSETVEDVRAELVRLGMELHVPGADSTDAKHTVAARTARQLVTSWVTQTLAEVEDNDYTAPHIQ